MPFGSVEARAIFWTSAVRVHLLHYRILSILPPILLSNKSFSGPLPFFPRQVPSAAQLLIGQLPELPPCYTLNRQLARKATRLLAIAGNFKNFGNTSKVQFWIWLGYSRSLCWSKFFVEIQCPTQITQSSLLNVFWFGSGQWLSLLRWCSLSMILEFFQGHTSLDIYGMWHFIHTYQRSSVHFFCMNSSALK